MQLDLRFSNHTLLIFYFSMIFSGNANGHFPEKSIHDHQINIRFFQNRSGQFVGVYPFEDDALDTCIYQHFRTNDTGLQSDIDGRTFCADADFCRLNDGILLCG